MPMAIETERHVKLELIGLHPYDEEVGDVLQFGAKLEHVGVPNGPQKLISHAAPRHWGTHAHVPSALAEPVTYVIPLITT